MQFQEPKLVTDLLTTYNLSLIDDKTNGYVLGLNEIHKVTKGDLTFVDVAKYYDKVLNSTASFIIINEKIDCPEGKCLLYSENPFLAYNQMAQDFFPRKVNQEKEVSKDAIIGENTIIYPTAYIGKNVKIGKNCIIHPNVTIYPNVTIGNNVIIHSNTAVGSEAFYYNRQQGEYIKMHTIGATEISDFVEIGSNCSIDSGVSGITKIGRGTKLDNQIHIGHGVEIGENCLLCAQVAIAGKSIIGNNVTLYGKVAVSKGLHIGDDAIILATSNVGKDLEGGKRYFGSPAEEARIAMKHFAATRMLPSIMEKLKSLLGEEAFAEK